MFLKVIVIIAFIGIGQAIEQAYSSQSITRFDSHHGHEEQQHEDYKYEDQNHEVYDHNEYKNEYVDHDNEKQHVEHKSEHKVAHPTKHYATIQQKNVHEEYSHEYNDHKNEQHHIEHKTEHEVAYPTKHYAIVQHKSEHFNNENENKKYFEPEPQYHNHKVQHKVEHNIENKVVHKQEHQENKNENRKEENYGYNDYNHEVHTKFVPVIEKQEQYKIAIAAPVKVVPVAEYINKGAEEHYHEHHEAAVSSQHISRHDVPAPAPKDFYDHSGPAKYEFAYEVKDPHTGDQKYQHESRNGHTVKGVYSLHEADGSIRTVEYAADKHAGFSAAVKQTTKHIEGKSHQ